MIQFSAWGTFLLLVPQGRVLIQDRAPIAFLRKNGMFKPKIEEEIICPMELCMYMDIIVGKLR